MTDKKNYMGFLTKTVQKCMYDLFYHQALTLAAPDLYLDSQPPCYTGEDTVTSHFFQQLPQGHRSVLASFLPLLRPHFATKATAECSDFCDVIKRKILV